MSRVKVFSGDSNGYSPPGYYREPEASRVDVNSKESLDKWQSVLELSRSELLNAVEEFGPLVKNIRKGLLKKNQKVA